MDNGIMVKVTLTGEDAKKFCIVKKQHGVLHNSEVIRILVNDEYETIKKEA